MKACDDGVCSRVQAGVSVDDVKSNSGLEPLFLIRVVWTL